MAWTLRSGSPDWRRKTAVIRPTSLRFPQAWRQQALLLASYHTFHFTHHVSFLFGSFKVFTPLYNKVIILPITHHAWGATPSPKFVLCTTPFFYNPISTTPPLYNNPFAQTSILTTSILYFVTSGNDIRDSMIWEGTIRQLTEQRSS